MRYLICLLMAVSFSVSAKEYVFDFSWTYPDPQPEDIGNLHGLRAITACNLDGVDIPIPDGLISDFSVANTPLIGNPGQVLTCTVRAERIADGLVSEEGVASKKLIGNTPTSPEGALVIILP